MGLDMYLKAEKYVGGWDKGGKERAEYDQILAMTGLKRCDDAPSATVRVTVAYWRKANAIHKWFVDNVQGGEENCEESDVSRGQLAELVNLCKSVLDSVETVEGRVSEGTSYYPDGRVEKHTRAGDVIAQVGIAAAALPTTGGFFFGKTDYDEDYLADLRDTIKQLEPLLSEEFHKEFSVYYQASW